MIDRGLLILVLALLGVCFGSFANAAVWRLKVKKDIVNDRSECVHCHHKLAALDLIPVISWLMLRGKCRYCGKKIEDSPLVELAVMSYFVVSYLIWPYDLTTISAWIDFSLWLSYGVGLAILFVYDLKWYLLPNKVMWPLICLGALDFINMVITRHLGFGEIIQELVLAIGVIAGLYYFLYVISKGRWIGFGDVKLGLFMGLALGWQAAIAALITANVIGCLVIIPGLLSHRLTRSSRIPFGPFLILGFIAAQLGGTHLITWYINQLTF